jgi:predicted peroxiredoxin
MDIEVAVKGALDITHPEFESAHTYIKQLSGMGVGIHACPTCLKVAGYKSEDLMEGIIIANKDKFFDFTKGRIITLDY